MKHIIEFRNPNKSVNLLRSFVPEAVKFGTNSEMDNGVWLTTPNAAVTYFETSDQYVKVIFATNPYWGCTELSFQTILKSKVRDLSDVDCFASYLPDIDMTQNPNRATSMFRKVVHVAFTRIGEYDTVGFNGATPYLDRVYTRLTRLSYFADLLVGYGFTVTRNGRDIFLRRDTNLLVK